MSAPAGDLILKEEKKGTVVVGNREAFGPPRLELLEPAPAGYPNAKNWTMTTTGISCGTAHGRHPKR